MATEQELNPVVADNVQLTEGTSDLTITEKKEIDNTAGSEFASDVPQQDKLYTLDSDIPDSEVAKQSKKNVPSDRDSFYDRFIQQQEQAEFSYDLQSADTYWENRPEARKEFEDAYGAQAEEKFREYYDAKIEPEWRKKLEAQTEKIVLNDRYEWLLGEGENKSYDVGAVFEVVNEIHNGSRKMDHMLTDKTISDRADALRSKAILNDQGEIIKLNDDEKFWSWSKGEGFKMNYDDPRFLSKDGRKIVAFQYVPFDEEYRGDTYVKALYEGDVATGEIVSMWDTTNTWLNGTGLKESAISMIPRTAVRTAIGAVSDTITGTLSILGSAVQLAENLGENDDHTALNDWLNSAILSVKSVGKISKSEYDQSKTFTASNMLDFVAQVAAQLYSGKVLFTGTQKLTKVFLANNELLKAAKAAEIAGDLRSAGKLRSAFEMKYGFPARAASLLGMTLQTGDSVVTEARAAGFSEDEVAAIYLSYFGMMLGANQISMRMLDPYFTDATAAPLIKDIIKQRTGAFPVGKSDLAKLGWAKRTVTKMADALEKRFVLSGKAGHTEQNMYWRSMMFKGLNEALEEEVEFVGQEAVETMATIVSQKLHKGEKEIPKFDTFMEEGYWARQLPNALMNAVGGFMGGAMTHFLPGFNHESEHSFLIKGKEEERLIRAVVAGEHTRDMVIRQVERQKKTGALGSHVLSVKMNEKTGEFYKMTDPEAKDSISHAEAAYRAIMGQIAYYEALYGDSGMSYDEIKKLDPEIENELAFNSDHNLGVTLAKLHFDKRNLLNDLTGGNFTPLEGPKKESKPEPAAKKEDKKADKKEKKLESEVPGSTPGVTAPITDDTEELADAKDNFDAAVKERANLLGTTNYSKVADLLNIENQIDDLLSGKMAAKHIADSIVRNRKLNVFTKEGQKTALSTIKDSSGKDVPSPYAQFGDKLLDALLEADIALSLGHADRHKRYVEQSEIVKKLIDAGVTEDAVRQLAAAGRKTSGSIAIDRNTTQLARLKEGINQIISSKLSASDMNMMVVDVRKKLGLAATTEQYRSKLVALYSTYLSEHGLDYEENEQLSAEDITRFTSDNIDLIHKLSMSLFVDRAASDPALFMVSKVNEDREDFKEALIAELTGPDAYIVGEGVVDTSKSLMLKTKIDLAKKSIEDLKTREPKNAVEAMAKESELESQILMLRALEEDLRRAERGEKKTGGLDQVLEVVGPDVLRNISTNKTTDELTPLVDYSTPEVLAAKDIVSDYYTILANIAPAVPTVQKYGAATNLLNEITVNGTTLASSPNKIISGLSRETTFSVDSEGNTVMVSNERSKLDELRDMVIGDMSSPDAEFRSLDTAKMLLDAINIRLAERELLHVSQRYLGKLYRYTKKHIPAGNNRYDKLPKFMAEHIYDEERYEYLNSKTVRTAEEQEEFRLITERKDMIGGTGEASIYGLLSKAKEEVEAIIAIGERSQTADARTKVYKVQLAKSLTTAANKLDSVYKELSGLSKELDAAIDAFKSITTSYTDSRPEELINGVVALEAVFQAVYNLSPTQKVTLVSSSTSPLSNYFTSDEDNVLARALVDSMATNPAQFKKYYDAHLPADPEAAGAHAPTYPQEMMIRSVFSFITDQVNLFPSVETKPLYSLMLMVDGDAGTGKTTMVGYALSAAQKFLDDNIKASMKDKYDPAKKYNGVLFAGHYAHQAQTLKDKATAVGVRSYGPVLDKPGLFSFLEKDGLYENISIIAFDEATFIQAEYAADGNPTELEYLHERLNKINTLRSAEGLPKIKLVAIGDSTQGAWQEGGIKSFNSVGRRYN